MAQSSNIMQKQNLDRSIRLLAAQRQLYSDAKQMHNLRVSLVVGAGLVGTVLAATFPKARPVVGVTFAFALLFVSILGSAREKRRSKQAASIQEEFDTSVFSLTWNGTLVDRPSNAVIAEAANRHEAKNLEDWYTDTESLPRPLDILVCQRSNVAWGAADHRAWAATAFGFLILLIVLASGASVLMDLSFSASLTGVAAPLLPVCKELFEMWRSNLECASGKESVEGRIAKIWEPAMRTKRLPKDQVCREVQDQIFTIRKTNPVIPDWFYWLRRKKNEAVMRTSVHDYVDEALTAGIQATP